MVHLKDLINSCRVAAFLKIKFKVSGTENIPESGRFILFQIIRLEDLTDWYSSMNYRKHFKDIKFPVNDILTNIKNLSGIFLPVNNMVARQKRQLL